MLYALAPPGAMLAYYDGTADKRVFAFLNNSLSKRHRAQQLMTIGVCHNLFQTQENMQCSEKFHTLA